MYKHKLLPVIAAIMITSMAVSIFSISTTTVSATHTQGTPSISPTKVKAGSLVVTITVYNNGPDPVDNVRIILPSGFTGIAPTLKIPKDNQVYLGNDNETPDNIVTLPAGTIVELGAGTLELGADNVVKIPKGTKIRWKPAGDNVDALLTENLLAKITADFTYVVIASVENVSLTADTLLDESGLNKGLVRLLADTQVVRTANENRVVFPENTTVELVNEATATMSTDNIVTLVKENFVLLSGADNLIYPPGDNTGRNFTAVATATTNTIYYVSVDDNVLIWSLSGVDNCTTENIVLLAGTKLTLRSSFSVKVFENTQVVRAANDNVYMPAATRAVVENVPKGWQQSAAGTSTLPSGTYVEWWGAAGENRIASGSSLAFPIALTTPAAAGDYTIYVRTEDINDVTDQKTVTLTVDNAGPTVQISASPSWAKGNTQVTITVTASEQLAKLENVMVAEKNATENTVIAMTPQDADNTVWTGYYTTGDNNLRDNLATIYVTGSTGQYTDLVGNYGTDNTGTFTVDRMAPLTAELTQISGWPTSGTYITKTPGIYTNQATWTLENIIYDNLAGTLVAQAGMTVKIRIGTTVYEATPDADGYWNKNITLSEGTQEVGLQFVDRAGNASPENAENITLDTTKPSVTMISPASGARINDNTPLIRLTISDATLGIKNADFSTGDNSGYSVVLRRNGDNSVIDNLQPMNPQTISGYFNTLTFENQWPLDNALPDNVYNILVVAGDNLQSENVYFTFTIDTSAPTWTTTQLTTNNVTVRDSVTSATIEFAATTKKTSWLIAGGARKPGSTINVYVGGTDPATATLKGTTNADTTKNAQTDLYDYSLTITLSEGANQSVYIEEVDTASNSSGRVLLSTYTVDATPPVITLSAPAVDTTTDAAQITVSGTITDAIVTDPQTLTVTIDCTGAAVAKKVYLNADGSFSTTVPLVEGTNVINVVAADGAITATSGNQSISTRTVTRTVAPLTTYAIIIVVVALILAAIAIFVKK